MLTLASNVQPVKSDYVWTQTIYIQADGSIYPSTAPISSFDDVTYTLTDNIAGNVPFDSSAIVIQRDNIIIDGAGHTLQGTKAPFSRGIELTGRSNITIKNMKITAFPTGIYLDSSSNNSISGNNITANNYYGIYLDSSSNNSISGNNITANNEDGIDLGFSSNNSVSGNNITANKWYGIWLGSSDNSVSGNNITNNGYGIYLDSSNNSISGNNITNNGYGIYFGYSSNSNSVSGNNITNNGYGIWLWLYSSSNNRIYHNNFVNNTHEVYSSGLTNVWDDGYPSGGNYWSDYGGVDVKSGPNQDLPGSDGIGDKPYIIDANNQDRYPLMNPWGTGTPVASFTWTPSTPKVGETVTFDASSSTPNGGTIIKYEWNFGDGKYATGQIVTHTYSGPGSYIVTLNVTDSEGLWDVEQKPIQVVQPHSPKAEFTILPETAKVGELVKFDASSSLSGWNGTHNMPITEYRWDFGDGNRTTTSTPIIHHRFSGSGIYYVTLAVYAPGATPETDSTTRRVTVITIPVGGYSIPIQVHTKTEPVLPYIALVATLTAIFTKMRPKTKRKR
jgi:parallel beta-helix repeat protein